jgi:hypothetical protein
LNKKISLVPLLFAVVLLVPLVSADFTSGAVNIYVWVDKTQYNPKDTITLYFTIYNARSYDIMINQVDIQTPWFMYIKDHWEGNQTIIINKDVTAGDTYSNSATIPIPGDGRATAFNSSADISVTIKTDTGTYNEQVAVGMSNPPIHMAVQDMDTLVLLVAILIILIVVCTALIAAAIFLSARKPQEAYPPPSQSAQ